MSVLIKISKNINKSIVVCIGILISLVVLSDGISNSYRVLIDSETTLINELSYEGVGNENAIKFSDLNFLRDYFKNCFIIGSTESRTYVSNVFEANGIEASKILTDDNYEQIIDKEMYVGEFIKENSCNKGEKVAVISTDLALRLNKSYDIIGQNILLDDVKYTVVGIYKENTNIVDFLSNDGLEKIYVPYNCETVDSKVNNIIVTGKSSYRKELKKQLIKEDLGIDLTNYRSMDYSNTFITINQINNLFFCIINIVLIILIVLIAVRHLHNLLKKLKTKLKKDYFLNIIKNNLSEIIRDIIIIVGLILAVIIFINIGKFNFYIPSKFIPNNNVFDIKFYISQWKDEINIANRSIINNETYISRYYRNSININLLILLVDSILFVFLMFIFNIDKLLNRGIKRFLFTISFAFGVGIIVGLIFTKILGLTVYLDYRRYLILYFYFVVIKTKGRLNKVIKILDMKC